MPVRIYESKYPKLTIPTNVSVSQFLQQSNPDDLPVDWPIWSDFDDPENQVTYEGVRTIPGNGAAGLKDVLGVKEGDTVCIYAGNSVSYALLAHSIMWAGSCFRYVESGGTSVLRRGQPSTVSSTQQRLPTSSFIISVCPSRSPLLRILSSCRKSNRLCP